VIAEGYIVGKVLPHRESGGQRGTERDTGITLRLGSRGENSTLLMKTRGKKNGVGKGTRRKVFPDNLEKEKGGT